MLYINRNEKETWYQAGLRRAAKYGMEMEFDEYYKLYNKTMPEDEAVYYALSEWDLLNFGDE